MKLHNPHYQLVKLPSSTQITLYLIKEELKARKLSYTLQEAGFDEGFYQPHLDTLILESLGMHDGTDETFGVYTEIMDKRSMKIEPDQDVIMKQALKAYGELKHYKKKLGAIQTA